MASPIVGQSVCLPAVSTVSPPGPHATVYEIITNQILAELERVAVPWRKAAVGDTTTSKPHHQAAYLDMVWHAEDGKGPDFKRLAKESRNNVRECLMRLEVDLMAL